jgi:hypothetical protein
VPVRTSPERLSAGWGARAGHEGLHGTTATRSWHKTSPMLVARTREADAG